MPDNHARPIPLSCPICFTPLEADLLEITEDDVEVGQLFTFDYPTDNFHGILTKAEVTGILAQGIVRRMQRLETDI